MEFMKKYDNGLRLVVKKMDGLMSVTMGIIVGAGAAMETDRQDGISHFIEPKPILFPLNYSASQRL